jgi:hypothetical protein
MSRSHLAALSKGRGSRGSRIVLLFIRSTVITHPHTGTSEVFSYTKGMSSTVPTVYRSRPTAAKGAETDSEIGTGNHKLTIQFLKRMVATRF